MKSAGVDVGFMGLMFYCAQAEVVITRTRLPVTSTRAYPRFARRTIEVSEVVAHSCDRIREHPSACREMTEMGYNILVTYSDPQEGERAGSSRRFNSPSALPTIQFGFRRDPRSTQTVRNRRSRDADQSRLLPSSTPPATRPDHPHDSSP